MRPWGPAHERQQERCPAPKDLQLCAKAVANIGDLLDADKAGGYGIQGLGAVFVEQIKGSYTAVVGLPLFETANLLRKVGVRLWQQPEMTGNE